MMDRVYVSPMGHFDGELEKVTRGVNLRMLAPRLGEVGCRREGVKQISDRHEIKRALTGRTSSKNLTRVRR
jgi:hypothetical protein